MDVYLGSKRVRLDPRASIGKGGEADVFDLGDGRALKVWKTPDHPDYAGQDAEQRAAEVRIERHQDKLRAFPPALPDQVIAPLELATDKTRKRVVGYAMRLVRGAEPLLRYGEPSMRHGGLSSAAVSEVLARLHRAVAAIHDRGVVIGDFNDLNVLVAGGEVFVIDADSFQFGPYLCQVFTERFVDPLLCDPSLPRPLLSRPYSQDSDWYAFAVMVMQSLLCVGPYGGVFRPRSASARVPESARPLRRITVFDREVRYPKPAIPYRVLPDDLLDALYRVFVEDRRGVFPRRLLDALAWTRCPSCGVEHARPACQACAGAAPAVVKESTVVHGEVLATRILSTRGVILAAALGPGGLSYLVNEGGRFLREDRSVVMSGAPHPATRFAVHGKATLIGRGGDLVVLSPGAAPERIQVDCVGTRPIFDVNARARYWTRGGQLLRSGKPGAAALSGEADAVPMGEVLAGQTLFWVGPTFGLGFYRAGNVSIAFVFDADRPGLKDTVKLPFPGGKLTAATCVFDAGPSSSSNDGRGRPNDGRGRPRAGRAWLFLAAEQAGRTVHRCVVVREDGAVEAVADGDGEGGSWLGALTGKCAASGFLLSATDSGVVRVEVRGGALVETRQFPGTEPFVTQASRLLVGPEGLFVVDAQAITLLRIS
ncbi:hypothetical protein WME97_12595 [Sorangium sp. So ce367]|uniref:hypothetical protein n=1 Tax=Sorangium sp. So ce367 TaxID=3133305 RepID=UPI003F627D0E